MAGNGGMGQPRHAELAAYQSRRRSLRKWAVVYSLAAAPLPAVLLSRGMHVGMTAVIVIFFVQVAVWCMLNCWAVGRLAEESPLPRPGRPGVASFLPARRRWFAGLAAGVVAVMAPFSWFDREIEAGRVAALPQNVQAREQVLRSEEESLGALVAAPLPTVDSDPEIVSLRRELEKGRADLPRLRDELACEADGTCGSRQVGTEEVYEAKAAQFTELERRVDVQLPAQIEQRAAVVEAAAAAARQAVVAGKRRLADIGRELSAPPTWSGRRDALDDMAAVRWQTAAVVAAVAVVAFTLHYLLDVRLLQITARRVCSRRPASDESENKSTGGSVNADPHKHDGPAPQKPGWRWRPRLWWREAKQ